MLIILKEFFTSQIFGIILGAILTGGFTLIVDLIKSNREEKTYIKRKRESLYQKMYDFSMRFEKDIRTKKNTIMSKGTKDLWNEIQIESIFGKQSTMETFYDLYEDLQENLEKSANNIIEVHIQNNQRILEFYSHIKKELGIKD
ncbi:unknown [Clostridium sp. CAG:813]|jgi:hypothetical protein|nr:unknown [Clostridium sp. CAG:813]